MESKLMRSLLYVAVFAAACTGCQGPKDKLAAMEAEGLRSGKRADTIFMNIRFSMKSQEFFDYCLQMNQKHIFTKGAGGNFVQTRFDSLLKSPAVMKFYPEFVNDSISEMPMYINYEAWGPWNRHLFPDSLQQDLLPHLAKWYGGPFTLVQERDKRGEKVYARVDGNRKVVVTVHNEIEVKIMVTDLAVRREENEQVK